MGTGPSAAVGGSGGGGGTGARTGVEGPWFGAGPWGGRAAPGVTIGLGAERCEEPGDTGWGGGCRFGRPTSDCLRAEFG